MQDLPEQVCSLWYQSECKYVSCRQDALVHLLTSAWRRQQMHLVVQLTKVIKRKTQTCEFHYTTTLWMQKFRHHQYRTGTKLTDRRSQSILGTAARRQICDSDTAAILALQIHITCEYGISQHQTHVKVKYLDCLKIRFISAFLPAYPTHLLWSYHSQCLQYSYQKADKLTHLPTQ